MDTNRSFGTSQNTNDWRMPSGFEVESATLRTPVVTVTEPAPLSVTEKATNKLNELKTRAADAVSSVRGAIHDKVEDVRPIVAARVSGVRNDLESKAVTMRNQVEAKATMLRADVETRIDTLKESAEAQVTHLQQDVRSNPMKWAGISAGAGIGIGLISRWMHHRAKVRARHTPQQVLIIEAAC
jgi:ElaB/YqjD/DUF883 family membrane-anchored ribosome-binding protein